MASLSKQLDVLLQVKRINAQLKTVADLASGPIEDTLLTQAALLATEQRSLAPVDPESDTPGALKDSVRVERGTATSRKAIVIKIKAGGKKTLKTGAGGKAYDFGRAVEFGTQKMQPRPFFFPVYRARKKEIRAAARAAIKKAVRNVFK